MLTMESCGYNDLYRTSVITHPIIIITFRKSFTHNTTSSFPSSRESKNQSLNMLHRWLENRSPQSDLLYSLRASYRQKLIWFTDV